jgi:predicted site-specific integrase-resolvase
VVSRFFGLFYHLLFFSFLSLSLFRCNCPASGVNDNRPKLLALLKDTSVTRIVVEHQDRLTRFGFGYLETLLQAQGRAIEVMNTADNETEDVMADLLAIVSSFTARLYGQRRAKRTMERIEALLEAQEDVDAARGADHHQTD